MIIPMNVDGEEVTVILTSYDSKSGDDETYVGTLEDVPVYVIINRVLETVVIKVI